MGIVRWAKEIDRKVTWGVQNVSNKIEPWLSKRNQLLTLGGLTVALIMLRDKQLLQVPYFLFFLRDFLYIVFVSIVSDVVIGLSVLVLYYRYETDEDLYSENREHDGPRCWAPVFTGLGMVIVGYQVSGTLGLAIWSNGCASLLIQSLYAFATRGPLDSPPPGPKHRRKLGWMWTLVPKVT